MGTDADRWTVYRHPGGVLTVARVNAWLVDWTVAHGRTPRRARVHPANTAAWAVLLRNSIKVESTEVAERDELWLRDDVAGATS